MAGMKFDDPLTGGDIPVSTEHPVARPGKIVCIGRNYREHAKELGNDVPVEPLFFLKPSTSIIYEGDAIVLPPQSERVEFEGEIGIVIGSRLTKASEEATVDAIRGVIAVNDVTARDLQKKDSQWTRAKGFDSFCPIGNIATEFGDLSQLTVVTRVNGEERQRGSASDMVFSIPMLLSYVSHVMTLEPGDIVATGTPSGVAPISDGDVVEVEIIGLSKVSNPVTG
ncbi:MAG TPA: fumarylacetoacetate hydrolase family protein [Gemmatimonadaceae bacterium]|jgi:2-keto-4-pentenoate hydratase/2-oxohepta-3-ene-1,7-dioic acid hydratase in catechol pathway|nr:fumarylacetoacetate hydrolase family protein [Gemmatimonadaceae bacterium]